jgi:mRNA-degrading endonuclease toxin of MazEF toxin-antitoxin module
LLKLNQVYASESSEPDPVMAKMQLMSLPLNKSFLAEHIGSLADDLQEDVDEGLRTVLYL